MPFDKSKFIGPFKAETKEHIQKLNQGLLKLEKDPKRKELLETLMKEAHTIKGSAAMMGYNRIADVAHQMENGLEKAMNQKVRMKRSHFDLLFESLDAIDSLLEDKVTWEEKGISQPYVEELCKKMNDIFSEKKSKKPKIQKHKPAETEKEVVTPSAISPVEEESLRVNIGKLDKLMNLSGEIITSKIRLNELVMVLNEKVDTQKVVRESFGRLIDELKTVSENIDLSTSNMQDEILKIRMIPVSYLFNTFPRAMRDLAQEKGKDVELEITGENTKLDKSILDEMKDPIMHLLRNAVDHGIEEPKERQKTDKPKEGRIVLNAFQEGPQIVIEISDDGRGIDVNKVKKQAVEKGIISNEKIHELVDEQVMQLLFIPGFSTKETVTEISGRGVGLDVVRERIARLKGMVEVDSKLGAGTTFTMKLPITLAITESLLVASGSDVFAIPIDTIVETIKINPDEINTVGGKEVVSVRGHIIPLIRLNELFDLPAKGIFEKKFVSSVIVQSVEKKVGLLVDRLLGRQEVVRKPLGEPLNMVKNIAGATILGDGSAILILDIPAIIESAEGFVVRRPDAMPRLNTAKRKKKTILLAEDVLTTATLEKSILESVGYSVVIARNGQEALEAAGQEKFNLVITDILMPKMDGFELTTKLKKDKYYKNIPVIIVTTRESDEDKRRGLEAGAEAYILKSEFTSDALLDAIERLIG